MLPPQLRQKYTKMNGMLTLKIRTITVNNILQIQSPNLGVLAVFLYNVELILYLKLYI